MKTKLLFAGAVTGSFGAGAYLGASWYRKFMIAKIKEKFMPIMLPIITKVMMHALEEGLDVEETTALMKQEMAKSGIPLLQDGK